MVGAMGILGAIGDLFRARESTRRSYKTGRLKTPTKFRVNCSCGRDVMMSIPLGMADALVELKCGCGKSEVLYVVE